MGWTKKTRDTGLLDVTGGIEAAAQHVSGRLLLRRRGGEGVLILDDLVVDRSGTSTLYRLGSGFRPFHVRRDSWWVPNSASADARGTLNISTSGYAVGYQLQAGTPMTGRIVFDILADWPASYPGSEVQL